MNKKADELACEIERINPDIAIITETWLNDDKQSAYYQIDGYRLHRRDRTSKRRGSRDIYQIGYSLYPLDASRRKAI